MEQQRKRERDCTSPYRPHRVGSAVAVCLLCGERALGRRTPKTIWEHGRGGRMVDKTRLQK